MSTAIVTGSGGLIGSESVGHFVTAGFDVVGLENDMRAQFFGSSASTAHTTERLLDTLRAATSGRSTSISATRRRSNAIFAEVAPSLELVIHAAAQPSHDWAASDPQTDFTVNANGTLNLLEATRRHAPSATFVFCSTNKVYGDIPNQLPLIDAGKRLELPADHRYHGGIDTSMSIDASTHSLFGVSKSAADLLVQEYGRYFDMPTVVFRCGCLTGPNHAGAKLHGFLSYLMRCTIAGDPYTVLGYGGKQVRDNIHSSDLVGAFDAFRRSPRVGAVYNIGGGRKSNCSMLEAIDAVRADRRARARLDAVRAEPDRRPSVVDLRPRTVPPRLPRVGHLLRRRDDARGDLRAERGTVAGCEMKLSVVIPAHNEVESIGQTVTETVAEFERAGIDYEIVVVDDASGDGTADVVSEIADRHPTVRCLRSQYPPGFGCAVRAGLDAYSGDAVAIMMADLSDAPRDLVLYYHVLEQGYDCAFGTRFGHGGRAIDYPRLKLVINRIVNAGIRLLFQHGYNDTTNAFKAYRRYGDRPGPAAALQPLQPDRRVAAQGRRSRLSAIAVVPVTWSNRQHGVSKLKLNEMGSRYSVHRAVRVAGAPPQPWRLPAEGRELGAAQPEWGDRAQLAHRNGIRSNVTR